MAGRYRPNLGFTLLELIVVIIIVGVLVGLALPRLFGMVEYTRSTEAMVGIATIRRAIAMQYMETPDLMSTCLRGPINSPDEMYQCLGIENMDNGAGSHFSYRVDWIDPNEYAVRAMRNTLDGGNTADFIILTVTASGGSGNGAIEKCGTSAFFNIGPNPCP
jgi:prepilin-type N-terminal cleavage/methylation domain-containing protein